MKNFRNSGLSVVGFCILIVQTSIFIICIRSAYLSKVLSEMDKIGLIAQGIFLLMSIVMFSISFHDEISDYCKERGKNMSKDNLISRSKIANMLKQYQRNERSGAKLSTADIEFIKTLLLPVKAELIKGLQGYNVKRNIEYNEYQYDYADKCIQCIRDSNLEWALKWFICIYDCSYPFRTYCGYSELIVGMLLVSNIIGLCDKMLAEIDKSRQLTASISEKSLIQEAISDARCLNDLDYKIDRWRRYYSEISFQEYFSLTDSEYVFIHKSLLEAFRAIVACRKNGLSMETYVEKIEDNISCFFSALGAPGRPSENNFEKKRRMNFHEASKD
jgi:hypothetical protein